MATTIEGKKSLARKKKDRGENHGAKAICAGVRTSTSTSGDIITRCSESKRDRWGTSRGSKIANGEVSVGVVEQAAVGGRGYGARQASLGRTRNGRVSLRGEATRNLRNQDVRGRAMVRDVHANEVQGATSVL